MSNALKLRRGTTAQHATFTGLESEVTVDTTKDTLVVHDGVTAGGHPMAKEANVVTKTSNTGSAKLPVGTEAERDGSPLAGYMRFNTDTDKAEIYDGAAWGAVGGGATGAGGDEVFIENGQTVTTNYSIPSGKNALSVGPITVNSGASVTVPSGSRWLVL